MRERRTVVLVTGKMRIMMGAYREYVAARREARGCAAPAILTALLAAAAVSLGVPLVACTATVAATLASLWHYAKSQGRLAVASVRLRGLMDEAARAGQGVQERSDEF